MKIEADMMQLQTQVNIYSHKLIFMDTILRSLLAQFDYIFFPLYPKADLVYGM